MMFSPMEKILEKIFGKSPGLDVAFLVITALMVPLILRKDTMEDWGLLIVPGVWAGSLVLSWSGNSVDVRLFGPLYGVHREMIKMQPASTRVLRRLIFPVTLAVDHTELAAGLDTKRAEAAGKLKYPGVPSGVSGIYESARTIFHATELWEKKIQSRLEFSKAARIFIFPLLIVLVYDGAHNLLGWPPYIPVYAQRPLIASLIRLSQYWLVMYLCLQIVALLYIYLRISHMSRLYDLVIKSNVFKFEISEKEHHNQIRRMLSIGSVVVPVCELSVFKKRILCVGKIDPVLAARLKLLHVACLEVKEFKGTASRRNMRKLLGKVDFDICVIPESVEPWAQEVHERLKAKRSPRCPSVYPDTQGAGLIVSRKYFDITNSDPTDGVLLQFLLRPDRP
jgi:hypothetical protein